ncbi:hypothetical protein PISMIDRAFT_684049 [Pisolithus microcarpus 441]|uniref:Uncharacterized protein n=1 Tax=Pisolithus microcarpus 441 TaxID=765257 RepID=A0A0C9Y1N1_9AGAM|nr:hypothetical protein PISMIDRAFT_684049 [Pisolithus microcarpus 441]
MVKVWDVHFRARIGGHAAHIVSSQQISQVTHLLHSCVLVASSYHLIGSMQTNFETYYDNLSHEYHTESDHPTTGK